MVIANGGAYALGRKIDDLIFTAMDTTTSYVGSYSGVLTRELAIQAVETLFGNDVPDDGDCWGMITPRSWSCLMTVDEFSSADFINSDLPFLKGRSMAKTWMGVNWMMHTGLPGKATATCENFVYHRSAIGAASGMDITADITWEGTRAAHWVNNMMSMGSVLIDAEGVVEIRTDDTTAIPTS
jgi:hypothetical protein